jgi:hypothetical protein
VFWNGVDVHSLMEAFSTGTVALGSAIAEATKNGAFS